MVLEIISILLLVCVIIVLVITIKEDNYGTFVLLTLFGLLICVCFSLTLDTELSYEEKLTYQLEKQDLETQANNELLEYTYVLPETFKEMRNHNRDVNSDNNLWLSWKIYDYSDLEIDLDYYQELSLNGGK